MNKQLLTYISVSFGFSWALAVIMWQMGGLGAKGATYLMFPFMCGPGLAGLICVWRFNAGERKQALGFTGGWNLWLLWAWVIGVGIVVIATAVSLLGPNVGLRPPIEGVTEQIAAMMDNMALDEAALAKVEKDLQLPAINIILILQAVGLGAAINTPLMLSEELGWRGWLWHHLRPRGFWTATFWIGLLWGVWHAPIIILGHNYPGMPIWGPVLFTVFCMLYAPIFSYIREKNGSIWGPCVLHGAGNASAGMALMMQTNTDMPWRGVVGIGGFAVVIMLTLWVVIRLNRKDALTLTD